VQPERKQWWRTFSGGAEASVTLRRRPVVVHGTVADGDARDVALRAYVRRYPRSRRITHDAAVVVFVARDG
jgi:hypothetical protein